MSDQAIGTYIKLCRSFGRVVSDSVKTSLVMVMSDGICWVETYRNQTTGVWFNYPARGIQVRLS